MYLNIKLELLTFAKEDWFKNESTVAILLELS